MKYVLFYEAAEDVREKAPIYFAAHRARWAEFAERGVLLLIGPFSTPEDGAMAVFTTRGAAEAFARDDPFVTNHVVRDWSIKEWNEALS